MGFHTDVLALPLDELELEAIPKVEGDSNAVEAGAKVGGSSRDVDGEEGLAFHDGCGIYGSGFAFSTAQNALYRPQRHAARYKPQASGVQQIPLVDV